MSDGIFRPKGPVEPVMSLREKLSEVAPGLMTGTGLGEVGFTKGVPSTTIPQTISVSSPYCYAKYVRGQREHYFIKVTRENFLYNPWDTLTEGLETARGTVGNPELRFEEVPMRAFEQYLMFLNTRNRLFLQQAEGLRL